MKTSFISKIAVAVFLFAISCTDHVPDPQKLTAEPFLSDLDYPFAITKGAGDWFWITEVGDGTVTKGKVSAVSPDGKIYPAFIDFASEISPEDDLPTGISHLTYKDGYLYIVQGLGGFLYKIKVSDWKPTDPPVSASSLTPEDIGSYVTGLGKPSHLYNLTWGPDGHLYFVDAAANLIVHRKAEGDYSVFTTFAQVSNPTPIPPPMTDFVPTGIVYDGSKFLVSSLTGFPFNKDKAIIQEVKMDGTNSVYKSEFTLLTDLVLTPAGKPLALQYSIFDLTATIPGFQKSEGKVLNENGDVLLEGLTLPTDIERVGDKTYYIVSMQGFSIMKLTY